MNGSLNEFYEKAALLGHDTDKLAAGETVISYGTFASLLEGRRLLSMATDAQRVARQQSFFNPPLQARQRLGQGIHDRGEALVFADGVLLDGDHQGIGNHMPAHIKAISVLQKTIPAGEVWDVSVRGEAWGIDDMEELYTAVNVGELIIGPGAKLIVRGNVFSLLCQRLVCLPPTGDGTDDYQLGILPTPFSVDNKNGDMDGGGGADGLHGGQGVDGKQAHVSSSILGYTLTHDITEEAMCGSDGGDGKDGAPGIHGRNGGMCKLAEITVRNLEGRLAVFAQAGQGGNGGRGGDGGDGGHGGHGAQGYKLIRKTLNAGTGGKGGNAGSGGKGGMGGNGGLASNIYINLPTGQQSQVSCIALASHGGYGGRGGKAGVAGHAGLGGKGVIPGADGLASEAGTDGKDGMDGRSRPAPWMFVNEQRRTGETVLVEAPQMAASYQ